MWLGGGLAWCFELGAVAMLTACGGDLGGRDEGTAGSGIGTLSAGTDTGGATTSMQSTTQTSAGSNGGTDDGGGSGGGGIKFDMMPIDFGGKSYGCSQDLKRVINLDTGVAVETCPPDQGCLDGECVPACEAAAEADGSMGCEFLVPTSPFYANGNPSHAISGPCHAVMVANPWDRPAMLDLSRDGMDYDVFTFGRIPSGITNAVVYDPIPATGVPPGQVAVLFLSHRPGVVNGVNSLECPVTPAVLQDTAAHGTTTGTTFELNSDTPIQLYDIIPYGGASSYLPSASLLYPKTSWGTDYVAITPHAATGAKWLLAVAAEDATTVEFNPVATINAGTIAQPPPAVVTSYTLNAGEVVQWQSSSDLGGSLIAADKPIAVFAGNTYLRVSTADNPNSGQDSAHQQISDVNALAHEFVGPGLYSRLSGLAPESVLYRLTGVVDGTQLTWDAVAPAGAPATLDAGQVVEFQSRELFSVRSQDENHPFSLSQYMSGTLSGQPGCGNNSTNVCTLGDDEWVVLAPPQQYLDGYTFFVDPTYGTTTLVVTRVRGDDGFSPVELECMGEITGWQPVGAEGIYEVAHVELFRGSTSSVPACETSQHRATSEGKFGIMVWGTDSYASYGYPAGGSLATINEVDINPAG